MPRRHKLAVLAIQVGFLIAIRIFAGDHMAFAILIGFLLLAAPWFICMELFDRIDKVLDRRVDSTKQIEFVWHIIYAVGFGVIFASLWPIVVQFAVSSQEYLVSAWLMQILPFGGNQPDHPFWIFWPAVTSIGGYLIEKLIVQWSKRPKHPNIA